MNKNKLKAFARETRSNLIKQIEAKLDYVLTHDSSELRNKEKQLNQLRAEIQKTSKEEVIEKVAYIWFNRLIALRFMDVNNFHLFNMKVVSPQEGSHLPQILQEAKQGHIDDKITIDRDKVSSLLEGRIPADDPQNEVYQMLLVKVCNFYHKTMPFMFEVIEHYTELLLPDNLLSESSIRADIVNGMSEEDCKEVEVIGWIYQYYISEKKDKVISAKKKYTNEEIPAATQLFTPKWIVKYMVENTLGQLWLEARPNSKIKEYMEFYIEPSDKDKIPAREIKTPEDIKIFEPCCGSGHILVYAFDLLTKIYEEEGYDHNEIPSLILQNNLYGIDIDERASELANFALMMKSQSYYKRFLRKAITPNVFTYENSDEIEKFKHANVLGSLIRVSEGEANNIKVEEDSLFGDLQSKIKKQAQLLSQKYDCVITNPPYMNSKYMNLILSDFVSKEYKEVKADLFSCFILRCREMSKINGMLGFVTPYVWMFIQSYEDLRKFLINNTNINNLIQLEYNAFEPACVPVCTFTLRNQYLGLKGDYIKLSDFTGYENQPIKTLEAIQNPNINYRYFSEQKSFNQIPSSPIAYWVSDKVREIFGNSQKLGDITEPKVGLQSSNTDLFLKQWFEVSLIKIGFNISNNLDAENSKLKWFPINKGGEYRKWFGNNDYVVNWEKNGFDIKNFRDEKGKQKSRPQNVEYYFREGLSWSRISSSKFAVRYNSKGFIFSDAGCAIFPDYKNISYFSSYLCSNIAFTNLLNINPTLNFQIGDISSLPIIFPSSETTKEKIDIITQECIDISKEDWDSRETSWDFIKNELLKNKESNLLEIIYEKYCEYWKSKFYQLHNNEEELNRLFIDIYELQDELNPNVALKDITILKDETTINDNNELEFKKDNIIKQFISYAVGCMFGRYSLDKEGLIIANQGETLQDLLETISLPSFTPDEDNVIPILNQDYFKNDIVTQFKRFLKASFGEENYQKNLDFIEEAIEKDIRNYFLKDFYKEHLSRYRNRPIYWLFSSKNKNFNALIYMHRYTSDTPSIVLNKYLREYKSKLQAERDNYKNTFLSETVSSKDKKKADKEIGVIDKMLKELNEYEIELSDIANQRIDIDLDDGVRVNYTKFETVLYPIKGLKVEE